MPRMAKSLAEFAVVPSPTTGLAVLKPLLVPALLAFSQVVTGAAWEVTAAKCQVTAVRIAPNPNDFGQRSRAETMRWLFLVNMARPLGGPELTIKFSGGEQVR